MIALRTFGAAMERIGGQLQFQPRVPLSRTAFELAQVEYGRDRNMHNLGNTLCG